MSYSPPVVLAIAASDPSGGAGLQADILTLASLGCHPLSVVTAITVQDTVGVQEVLALDPEWVVEQTRGVLKDVPVDALKIGLLGSAAIVAAVAEVMADYSDIPLVLDPVLASGHGDELANEDMISAIRKLIVPQSTVITPNTLEARRLALDESRKDDDPDRDECARRLLESGCEYVLITGTHDNTRQVVNTLYRREGIVRSDAWERLPGSYHGSGCTLASAVAASLAHGLDVADAARQAQEYTWQALRAGYRPGMGQYIPNRLFWAREQEGYHGGH